MARQLALVLSAALLLPPSSVFADPPDSADEGMRVRLTVPELADEPLIGTLIDLESDAVLLQVEGRSDPMTVQRNTVTRWEVSRGRKSNVLRGTGWGLLAGAGAGMVLAVATHEDDGLFSEGEAVAILAGFFGGIGAGIGALVGLHKTERWEEVETPALRLGVMPVPRGVGLSVQWTFGEHSRTRVTRGIATSPPAAAGPPLPAFHSSSRRESSRSSGGRP